MLTTLKGVTMRLFQAKRKTIEIYEKRPTGPAWEYQFEFTWYGHDQTYTLERITLSTPPPHLISAQVDEFGWLVTELDLDQVPTGIRVRFEEALNDL